MIPNTKHSESSYLRRQLTDVFSDRTSGTRAYTPCSTRDSGTCFSIPAHRVWIWTFDKKSEKWKDRHVPDCPAFPLTACHTGHMICVSEHAQTYSHSLCPACLRWSRVPINLKLSCRGPRSVQVTHQPAHRGHRVPAQHVCSWCVRSYVHCFTDVWVRFRGMWLHWKRRLRVFFH